MFTSSSSLKPSGCLEYGLGRNLFGPSGASQNFDHHLLGWPWLLPPRDSRSSLGNKSGDQRLSPHQRAQARASSPLRTPAPGRLQRTQGRFCVGAGCHKSLDLFSRILARVSGDALLSKMAFQSASPRQLLR